MCKSYNILFNCWVLTLHNWFISKIVLILCSVLWLVHGVVSVLLAPTGSPESWNTCWPRGGETPQTHPHTHPKFNCHDGISPEVTNERRFYVLMMMSQPCHITHSRNEKWIHTVQEHALPVWEMWVAWDLVRQMEHFKTTDSHSLFERAGNDWVYQREFEPVCRRESVKRNTTKTRARASLGESLCLFWLLIKPTLR